MAGERPDTQGPKAPEPTRMFLEAAEAGAAVVRFLAQNGATLDALGQWLRGAPPPFVVTCARGSSDHAATYAKYLVETRLGIPTVSAAFSTVSLFDAPLASRGEAPAICLAISQSGRSPDLLATVERYRAAGAWVIVLVNDETAPLAGIADALLPLCAGPETSVAATKSYITSLVGIAALVGAWSEDKRLCADLAQLPERLDQSFNLDWSPVVSGLANASSLFTIGRGYSLAIAQEAALKLKETCGLHGEAFSAAEARHGPMAIVREGFPVLAFATDDAAGDDVRELCGEFASRGALVWLADAAGGDEVPGVVRLPALRAAPELSPLLMIASFYRMAESLSRARGYDPDRPPHLSKVTRTR